MTYSFAPDIAIAHVADTLIFLDIKGDRYFRLPREVEHELIAIIGNGRIAARSALADRAVELGALVLSDAPPQILSLNAPDVPQESAIDRIDNRQPRLADLVTVAWSLGASARLLRRSVFAQAIESPAASAKASDKSDALALATRFDRARRLLPLAPKCLRDSLALRLWLRRRGVHATLVLGVTGAPFSAHCWLEAGNHILNETSDAARRFTPILSKR
jgi:hypothetical protein